MKLNGQNPELWWHWWALDCPRGVRSVPGGGNFHSVWGWGVGGRGAKLYLGVCSHQCWSSGNGEVWEFSLVYVHWFVGGLGEVWGAKGVICCQVDRGLDLWVMVDGYELCDVWCVVFVVWLRFFSSFWGAGVLLSICFAEGSVWWVGERGGFWVCKSLRKVLKAL